MYVCISHRYDVALAVDLQGRSKAGRVMQSGPQYTLSRVNAIYISAALTSEGPLSLSSLPRSEIN